MYSPIAVCRSGGIGGIMPPFHPCFLLMLSEAEALQPQPHWTCRSKLHQSSRKESEEGSVC